ncbi:uncharacterized protein CG43427 isoform X3 [Drosophila hydei]|uniref:Uncharacterized protein CG43427 isoform X3 n=1 Tax=Drosophila hydei TaxID=7224 RepID=A0A6J2SUW7_DROHY|nr:uncharacterized protein CG43427 isoform X3 [Drosophila hydei]
MESESMEQDIMLDGNEDQMSTSNTSTNSGTCEANGCGKKSSITSPDPTLYVTKARVTRPTPPPPSKNPMQFVQIKPCNLYQTAQEQLKKAEEVKKLKEVKKEEPEEWQNNLDNWKSSRRKRVEHIIDRVVETKKLELEEHDRTRRKSKTFTEMMEERAERSGSRGRVKLASLAVYNEDETNDLSDLGIGTSSASGKSSLSEDYDNNSVMSDNAELDKAIGAAAAINIKEQQNHINRNRIDNNKLCNQASTSNTSKLQTVSEATAVAPATREFIMSPGYDTSSSTALASTPDPCEYTYEGAIQDYKQRVQRASSNGRICNNNGSGDGETIGYPTRRGSKIEDRLSGFEVTSPSDTQEGVEKQKVDVPKVDISKRKEIFEQRESEPKPMIPNGGSTKPKLMMRERLKNSNDAAPEPTAKQEIKRLSGDICSIRDRMQSLEQQRNEFNSSKSVDVSVLPLKQRLNSLQQHAVTKEEDQQQQKKPPLVALIDARQLEIMRGEELRMRQQQQKEQQQKSITQPALIVEDAAHDDSGIQADNNEEILKEQQQQHQLNEAIAALALEERQLEEAANAVNQIEAEFDELTDLQPAALPPTNVTAATISASSATATSITTTTATQPAARDMEFSNEYELNEEANEQQPLAQSQPGQLSQIFDFTKTKTPIPAPEPTCLAQPTAAPQTEPLPNPLGTVAQQNTQIPRPLGKPPMSPNAVRVKPTTATPQQFSINGRVEIFNSRQLEKPQTPPVKRALKEERTSAKVGMFAPSITTVSTEELRKPNTIKPLSSCSGQATKSLDNLSDNHTPISNPAYVFTTCTSPTPSTNVNVNLISTPLPKTTSRSRIPQITPPVSPKPNRKTVPTDVVDHALDHTSGDYAPIVGQTKAVVHTPPVAKVRVKPPAKPLNLDPLAPNDSLEVHVTSPSPMPALRVCTPNESSLFKLANSAPTSPGSTGTLPVDIALCQQFMESEGIKQRLELTPEDIKRLDQQAVKESTCKKIDVTKTPKLPSTGCQIVTEQQLQSCDGIIKKELADTTVPKEEDIALCVSLLDCLAPAEEPSCIAIDVREQPIPATGYQHISDEDVKHCDGLQGMKELKKDNNTNNVKASFPISNARAAHSRALLDTCEQIIAEERLASNRMMKSSLPVMNSGHKTPTGSTPGTPTVSRKSKIPIPKPCCISASNTDSIGRTGYLPANAEQSVDASTPIVDTAANIKQLTPPSSPKTPKDVHEKEKGKDKKNKSNIFDFLRRNFGHHEESTTPQPYPTLNETLEPKVVLTSTRSGVDVVSADDFVKVDNSKFYFANDTVSAAPPPLPKTAAPVNIDIQKSITTDEILVDQNTEQALSQEISNLLDDELNKLGPTV